MNNTDQLPGGEDQDLNNADQHDPVEAGKKAIEAERLTNDKDASEAEEKDDAENWRNEG